MTKRTVHTLALMMLATPLVLVGIGCSDSGDKDGGSTGVKMDGAAGSGGSVKDGGGLAEVQAAPTVDAQVVDTQLPIDTTIAPDAPQIVDTTLLDVNEADAPVDTRPPTIDLAAIEAQPVDTTPAVDATPVVPCTEVEKFSGGDVATDRTLSKACSPYTIKDTINVAQGATLTIEAGTTLKFATDTQLYVYAGALLNAVGTAAEPIVLTSSKSAPAAGDWDGVQVQDGGNSVTLKYVTITYAGYSNYAALDITNAMADVEHCQIHDNANVGLDATGSIKGTKVLANTFYSNGDVPLVISDGVQADASNAFHSGALVNTKPFVSFAGDLGSKRTFDITEIPYLFADGASVTENGNVTVNAGVTLAFGSDAQLYIYAGAIFSAVGTATSPIVFTSSKSVPAKGDWDGLDFQDGASSITIKYATVQYAGFGSTYAVNATSSTFDIENCTIQHNLSGGLDGDSSTQSILKNNTFSDNNADGASVFNWSMQDATNATVSGNTPDGTTNG